MSATDGSAGPEQAQRWVKLWDTKFKIERPGFHEDIVHPRLIEFKDRMVPPTGGVSFFVPLCGKTRDLAYLTQFGFVGGVEVAQEAIDQLAAENNLEWDADSLARSDGRLYRATPEGAPHMLAVGKMDFFNLPEGWSDLGATGRGRFNRCWDRASLVAVEPGMREQYVQVLLDQLTPDALMLLSTYQRTENVDDGPPFSVSAEEVHRLFGRDFDIELLRQERTDFIKEGFELTFLLERRTAAEAK